MSDVTRNKYSARLNDDFDALLCINEATYDGFQFYYGTGIVTQEFHRWFGEQVQRATTEEEFDFDGRVKVTLEDGRVGRALVSHVGKHDPEAGSKIAFVFQGGLVQAPPETAKETT